MVLKIVDIQPRSGVQPRDQLMWVIVRLSLHRMMRDAYMTLFTNDCQCVCSLVVILHGNASH